MALKNFLYRILCGFFLGLSVFAPGISGSVMAIIMGIYQKLLDIMSNPLKRLKQNILFLFPMGIGACISLLLFVLVFNFLFNKYETATCLLFTGLIAGNIPMVYKNVKGTGFKKHYLVGAGAAFIIALATGVLSASVSVGSGNTPESVNLLYFGFASAVSGAVALVPGMSISMMLIVLGIYHQILNSASELLSGPSMQNIALISVVALCFTGAMVVSSRFIRFVFKRFPGFAHSSVLGFMCGSLAGIAVTLPLTDVTRHLPLSLFMLACGLFISFSFISLGKKFGTVEE